MLHNVVQPPPKQWRSRAIATVAAFGIVASSLFMGPVVANAAPLELIPMAEELPDSDFKALVFSKTAGFRHDAIPAGIAAVEKLGLENNFDVDTTEDGADFNDENLKNYDVVIWMSTTGDVLNEDQQGAFERFIEAGGGYAGVHAASDTEYTWDWYGGLVGAYFAGHPAPQNASVKVEDHVHPSTVGLGDTWDRFDEWYSYDKSVRDSAHVLMSLDEASYTGGTMGTDHPIAWCQNYEGGRSWYTGGGHTQESYADPKFLSHLLGGIKTAAGVENADCSASQSGSYELVTLDDNTGNPMALAIAPDKTVFYAERDGRVQRIDPVTHDTTTALKLNVTLANEDGLLGAVLDPDFHMNGWGYFYWSPTNPGADGPHNRISRFTYNSASGTFDPASEIAVLKIPTQRNTCCHAGGDMLFDGDGNLVLATGDNTNPFESDGYSPIDERPGRDDYDAQRTSANTNDLRGKIVRIKPTADGSYTIPEGNLFEASDKTRAEIYGMGFRNPFRIGLDPYTGNYLVADYGPDAGSANANRGPGGSVEWNILSEAGNYGWPLCVGLTCYNDYNFDTKTSGAKFDRNAPVNNSPNNTGLTTLPPVITPEWWTENGTTAIYPEIGNSGAPMAGALYQFDPELDSDTKWPEYWDGKAMFAEWNQGKMYSFQLNEDTTTAPLHTEIVDINRMLPEIFDPNKGFSKPMDFEFGPDGSMYVVDWGSDFGGNTENSGVYRVDYVQAAPSPIAKATADVTHGGGPTLAVQFSSEGTRHPVSKPISLSWDFGDGTPVSTEANPSHTYTANGAYTATLTVTDEDGKEAFASVPIVVGNEIPTVSITFPESGGFFRWGDDVAYKVEVNDPDATGPIDCSNVQVLPALGHDSHQHPMQQLSGCEGTIKTARDAGHGIESNIFWVVDVRYTDDGGAAGIPLTGYGLNILNPKHFQAEFFDQTGALGGTGAEGEGVQVETTGDVKGGGQNVSYVEANDWWSYTPVNFKGIDGVTMRIASAATDGGTVQMRWNAPDGPLLGEVTFPNTGDWQEYQDFTIDLENLPAETGTLYLVQTVGGANYNYFEWNGSGVDANSPPTDVVLTATPRLGSTPLVVDASATGTDPDGGDVTFMWNQGTGEGFFAGTASEKFTYTVPGTYSLTVRATDEGGAYTEEMVTITVTAPGAGKCLSGRSDGFDGTNLDASRWNRIVRPNQDAHVADGHLIIPATQTDIYGAGEGTVPNIVMQDLPEGAWQATTKVTFEARNQYQQAGLVVYGDDDNYAKMALQGRSSGSDAAQRIFQFVVEEGGEPNEVAASNTANLGADFPDTYYVRMASDGSNLTAAYSADGVDFTAMPETKSLAGMSNPRIGVMAFANSGSTADVIDANFDWFHITPDSTAVVDTPNDEFGGAALDACRWSVVNEDASGYRVSDGNLEIDTSPFDIYGADSGVENFIVQAQPEGDWVVETKLDGSAFDRGYQQGGLILYVDDDNYVKVDMLATNSAGSAVTRGLEMRSEIAGVVQDPQPNASAPADGVVWLRMGKTGDTLTGWYSTNGSDWTAFADTLVNPALASATVGLYALGNPQQGDSSATARFDYFHVVGNETQEPVTVSATTSPETPDGSNDWFKQNVAVTVHTAGGGESTVYREINQDGTLWREYTAPLLVTDDGEHTIDFRASAPGQDAVNGETLTLKIDKTVPTVSAVLDAAGTPRTVTITAADATSGVATTEYRLGDGEWQAYVAAVELDGTAQSIAYRATDAAGNVSAEGALNVPAAPVDPADPIITLDVSLDPAAPNGAGGWYTTAVDLTAVGTTTGTDELSYGMSVNGEDVAFTGAGTIDAQGTSEVVVSATDGTFAVESETMTLKIDSEVPTATASANGRTVTLEGSDATSGIDHLQYLVGEETEWISYSEAFTVSGTEAVTVQYRAVDVAGNASSAATLEIEADAPAPVDPALSLDVSTVKQGGSVVVTGSGFEGETSIELWLASDPMLLTTVVTDAQGAFSATVQIPASTEVGEHHIRALVGETELANQAITVTAAVVDPTDPPVDPTDPPVDPTDPVVTPTTPGTSTPPSATPSDTTPGSTKPGSTKPAGSGSDLPNTGASIWPVTAGGILILLAGLGMLLAKRRRETTRH